MYYTAGWNMPGYLPEMEPAAFATRDEAVEFLRDEFRILENQMEADECGGGLATVRDCLSRIDAGHSVVMFDNYHYWIEEAEGDLPADDIAA